MPANGTSALDAVSWGSSTGGAAGSAETTSTLGVDRTDQRTPPDTYHVWGAQLNACKNLLISISTTFKGGTRLGVLKQSSNPFGSSETGFYADNTATANPRFSTNGTLTYVANGAVTTKGDLTPFNGTNFGVLAAGSNNQVLVADSSQTTGLRWGVAPSLVTAQTPAFGATMNINPSLGEQCTVTLTGNLGSWTISAPAGPGQKFILTFTQDGTGSRTIGTPPASIKWLPSTYLGATHVAPTLTTTATKSDSFFFVSYDGTNWIEINRNMNN